MCSHDLELQRAEASCAPDSMALLRVCPAQLSFVFDNEREATCDLILRNMHEMQYIGFKIKTTAPDRYYVSPRLGSIPPQSELQLTLTRQPQSSFTSAEDRFLIEIATLPENSVSLSANELPPIEQQVFLKATVHTDEAQMPALVRALRELIDPRAAEHSQVLQGFIALLLARGILAESQKALASGVASELYRGLAHKGAQRREQNGLLHANSASLSQAGHPEADQQHSHPVIDRVGSRRLASMRSVQGASMLPARSLHMPDLDEELSASALSRQQQADSAAPATSYQPQSSRAYELAAVGEDTYLGRADEQDRTFGMAGLTTTQWSDDSILSQDTDDMELPAAKTRELSAPFHLQTVPASSPNSHIGSGMLTHASGLEAQIEGVPTGSNGDDEMNSALARLGFTKNNQHAGSHSRQENSIHAYSPHSISSLSEHSPDDGRDAHTGDFYATPVQAAPAPHTSSSGGFDPTRPMINIDLADEFMDEQAPSVLAQQGWSLSAQSPSGSSSLRPNKPATIPEAEISEGGSQQGQNPLSPYYEGAYEDDEPGDSLHSTNGSQQAPAPSHAPTNRWRASLPHIPSFHLHWAGGRKAAGVTDRHAEEQQQQQAELAQQLRAAPAEQTGDGKRKHRPHHAASPARISTPPPHDWHPASRAEAPRPQQPAHEEDVHGSAERSVITLPERILSPLSGMGPRLRSNSSNGSKSGHLLRGDNSNIHPLLADDYRMQLPRQQHSANAYYTDSFGDGQLEPQPTGIH